MGNVPLARDAFLVKCTLQGEKRLLGDVLSADPLLPEDLLLSYNQMDYTNVTDLMFWGALVLSYRYLLCKGHDTVSPHTLQRGDLEFTKYGACIKLRLSKTIQFREWVLQVPIVRFPGQFCAPLGGFAKVNIAKVNLPPNSPLFVMPKTSTPMTYAYFSGQWSAPLREQGWWADTLHIV